MSRSRLALPALLLAAQFGLAQTRLPSAIDAQEFAARMQHWAWQPLKVPSVAADATAIDELLANHPDARGMEPAAPAAPHELLRRLWFDLVGLPPSAATVQQFLADPSEVAYAAQVEALLNSRSFAERHARHWLDLVRYSETLGHEFDFELPNAFRYRDYVIRAIDADVPLPQFVQEHVAGDLLDPPRRGSDGSNESVQGTAFWWFVEQAHAPVDARQHTSDRIDNQIDVLGKSVLGMTIACARCHDHKFDAIRAADYYALAGFVRSSRYAQVPLQPCDVHGPAYQNALQAQRETTRLCANHGAKLAAQDDACALRAGEVLLAHADRSEDWTTVNDAFGNAPWREPWTVDPAARPLQLRSLPGAWWHSGIAGTQREGVVATRDFTLTTPYLHVRVAGENARLQLIVDGFHLPKPPIYGGLHRAISNPDAHWITLDVRQWPDSPAYLQVLDQRAHDLGDPLHEHGPYPDHAWAAVQAVIASPHAQPPAANHATQLATLTEAELLPEVLAAAARLQAARDALPVSPTMPGMVDGTPVDAPIFLRGKHDQLGPVVPRRLLTALAGEQPLAIAHGSGRRELAHALFANDAPLAARVFVNRLWHHCFGSGLVPTVDNFGALGAIPEHQPLLDWLANDLQTHHWSRKHLLRRIVLSQAYRRASQPTPALAERDPRNRWFLHQNLRRLEAEPLRDALLAVSGLLREQAFGPSVPLPKDSFVQARGLPAASGSLDGDCRRSIYLAVRRNFLSPMLQAFDLPAPSSTIGARSVSNVPAQALAMLNDAFVQHACRAWANQLVALHHDPDAALDAAYQSAFARSPDAQERAHCRAFLAASPAELPWADLLHCLVTTKEFSHRR